MPLKDAIRPYVVTARRIWNGELRLVELGYARRISYSQFSEDLWLIDYFDNQASGFYVDVGAYDPFNASNTLLLYRRGWSGINIEPDPEALARLRLFRKRDVNLGLAIDEKPGFVPFVAAGSFSSIDADSRLWRSDERSETINVEAKPLADVLAKYRPEGNIDLLDIDCEGHELQVLCSNDWERFRPQIVLVEIHPGGAETPATFLNDVGYRQVAKLQLTRVFERA